MGVDCVYVQPWYSPEIYSLHTGRIYRIFLFRSWSGARGSRLFVCEKVHDTMRAKVLLISSLICTALYGTEAVSDTVLLSDIEVSVSRVAMPVSKQQLQVSVLDGRLIEQAQVNTPKEVSNLVPNVYMPDYGSAMTSSIYIRGM